MKFPLGVPVLQYGDTLEFLNNNKFGADKAKAIFQVLKAMAEDIQKQSAAGKKVKINRNYSTYLQNVLYWRKGPKTSGNQIYVDTNNGDIYLGGFKYPISDVANREETIVDQLTNTFHNVNSETLSKNFHEPFVEYTIEDGNLVEKQWRNYQSYLLSSKGRSTQQTPLVTNVNKPTPELASFMQKYATLIDFELPVVQAPVVEKAAEAAAAPTSQFIGEFEMNNETVNTFEFSNGPIQFKGSVDDAGNISVEVIPNETITKVASDSKTMNEAVIPNLKLIDEANKDNPEAEILFDATAENEQLVTNFVKVKLIQELKKIQATEQEAPAATVTPAVEEVTAAPISEEAKPAEGTYNPNDTGAPADDYMRVAPEEEGGESPPDPEVPC